MNRWVIVILAVAVCGIGAVPLMRPQVPDSAAAPVPMADAGAGSFRNAARAPLAATSTVHAQAAARCPQQVVEVAAMQDAYRACVGETITTQNGSIRTYLVASLGAQLRTLKVEAQGATVLAAEFDDGSGRSYECREGECGGISISDNDSQGGRWISLDHATLATAGNGEPQERTAAVLSARLRTLPEDSLGSFGCAGQGVNITGDRGSAVAFCPKDGAGFELADDGRTTYRFTSLDGESITVALDQDSRVAQVAYRGKANRSCKDSGCGGVRLSPSADTGERTFTFLGTTLLEDGGMSTAIITGNLVVPPL